MATYESMHTMQSRMKWNARYMALKLDMSKGYDMIEQNFLKAINDRMCFDRKWIDLIVKCVSTIF